MLQGFVYWSDAVTRSICRASKHNGGNLTVLLSTASSPGGVAIVHAALQPKGSLSQTRAHRWLFSLEKKILVNCRACVCVCVVLRAVCVQPHGDGLSARVCRRPPVWQPRVPVRSSRNGTKDPSENPRHLPHRPHAHASRSFTRWNPLSNP